jgi:uncharacterized protein YaiI (UPF0178 family)
MRIWVDADACPVKDQIERIALRRGVEVVHVCALTMLGRDRPGIQVVEVPGAPDAADEWILQHCEPGDIVVTSDVPLAAAAVKLGAFVIEFRGREFHEDNAHDRKQIRDLLASLRDTGDMLGGGPRPFTAADRKAFSATLGRVLDRALIKTKQAET